MTEIIKNIEEFHGEAIKLDSEPSTSWAESFDGFKITTDKQVIVLGISNGQSCCEDWGYLLTEDDPSRFVGAVLTGLSRTDENRIKQPVPENKWNGEESLDEGGSVFLDIETDRGVLQFVAYNGHNGYYGHEVKIKSEQLSFEQGV